MIVRRVWVPVERVFHWALVTRFAAKASFADRDKGLRHWIGYAVLALVGLRVVWGLVGNRYARFASFPPDPAAALGHVADVARFLIKGCEIAEIARLRGTAEGNVKAHLNAIYRKSGVSGRAALVSLLIENLMEQPLIGADGSRG